MLPANAKSGIIYSVSPEPLPDNFAPPSSFWPDPYPEETIDQYMCEAAWYTIDAAGQTGWKSWYEFWRSRPDIQGTPLAVDVLRRGPGQPDPGLRVTSDYNGISRDLEGRYDPEFGGYSYYTPILYSGYRGFSSWIYIQNSGVRCTSVEIYFKGEGECIRTEIEDVAQLAPGETYQLDVATVMPPRWHGSAWLGSSEPLGIVVDHVGNDVLMSYNGVPATLDYSFEDSNNAIFMGGSQVNYGPLIYREYQGWDTLIYVQNLSSIVKAKVAEYINLEAWGYLSHGFKGSVVISGTFWEHHVSDAGAPVRNVVGLAAVKVERSETVLGSDVPGDESAGSEIIPVPSFFHFQGPQAPTCPGQP